MTSIGIIDYGVGNIRSLAGALEAVGSTPVVTSDPLEACRLDGVLLPGVGAFGDGMSGLRQRGMVEALMSVVRDQRKPILGICLGFQLFASKGFEFGENDGLGWINGEVKQIPAATYNLRLPHVGWNEVEYHSTSPLFEGIPDKSLFYFVHSFHLCSADKSVVIATTPYGEAITSAVQKDNVFGVQFHPEKSQRQGLQLLKNFVGIVGKDR
jgi:glutamine amidotransferase